MTPDKSRFEQRSPRRDDFRPRTRSRICAWTVSSPTIPEISVQDVYALPYYPKYDLEPQPEDYVLSYDRIPKHDVEVRLATAVYSSDRHRLGQVEGFVVDDADRITHLVLERGHLWERRDLTIPIGAVATVETDVVTLALTKDEVGALPEIPVRRWPTATQPDR